MDENKIIIYTDETNSIQLEVRMEREMVWVTRQQLAMLFERDYKTISKHINNALKEELADEVVVAFQLGNGDFCRLQGEKQEGYSV